MSILGLGWEWGKGRSGQLWMFELTVAVDTASGYRGDWQQHTEVVRETEKI